jgi:hypothetical protein
VYEPVAAGASTDLQVAMDGGTGQGDIVGRTDGPTQRGDAQVPYREVLPRYLDEAASALDELDLPPSLRTTVREYFENLAQGRR